MNREWYLEDCIAYEPGTSGVDEVNAIHVIEYSAYEAVIKKYCDISYKYSELADKFLAMTEKCNKLFRAEIERNKS